MKRLTTIDAARGIASILVMLYHCNSVVQSPLYFADQPFSGFFGSGSVRMPFFFAMSGFMLVLVHGCDIGRPERLQRYLLGRFVRIYPTYWAVLLLAIPAYLARPGVAAGAETVTGWTVLGAILLFPQPSVPFLAVAWTLESLAIFYVVGALAIWRRWVGALAFVIWQGAVMGALIAGIHPAFPWGFLLQTLYLDLLLGGLAAWAVSKAWVKKPEIWLVSGAVYLVVALILDFTRRPLLDSDWSLLTDGVAASVMLVGLAGWERSKAVRVPRVLLVCGAASYSIFLIHYPLLSVLSKLGKAIGLGTWLNGEMIFVLFGVVCVLAGILFHRWVEQPVTAWAQARVGMARRPERQVAGARVGTMEGTPE